MRLTDRWRAGQRPTLSFELFPARDAKAAARLGKVIARLAALGPDFVAVTFGAGGSTREGSLALARLLKHEAGLEVLPYLAGHGLGPAQIARVVDGYRDLGLDNLLVVRGDPPEDEAFVPDPESVPHASDLLELIRPRWEELCLGVAGYPEGHAEAPSKEADLGFLALKVARGARFVITQYVYDCGLLFDFVGRCRAAGIGVPIVAGVMPIYSVGLTERLARLSGVTITDAVRERLAELPQGDKGAVTELGVELAVSQCRELLEGGVQGLHLYTMNRAGSVVAIVERLRREGLLT